MRQHADLDMSSQPAETSIDHTVELGFKVIEILHEWQYVSGVSIARSLVKELERRGYHASESQVETTLEDLEAKEVVCVGDKYGNGKVSEYTIARDESGVIPPASQVVDVYERSKKSRSEDEEIAKSGTFELVPTVQEVTEDTREQDAIRFDEDELKVLRYIFYRQDEKRPLRTKKTSDDWLDEKVVKIYKDEEILPSNTSTIIKKLIELRFVEKVKHGGNMIHYFAHEKGRSYINGKASTVT